MYPFNVCDYFGILFLAYCAAPNSYQENFREGKVASSDFEVAHQWHYLNFTWPSNEVYQDALFKRKYIPENNVFAGIKYYKGRIYLTLPRLREGTPVTLTYISVSSYKTNQLLIPFPSWEMNVQKDCSTLQNVQSMEIDTKGIMWVLDGNRFNNFTRKCPAKLVLLDLNNHGRVVHVFEFSDDLSSRNGGFLNDIVIDESDGGYAYISETSSIDPGIIVYSKLQNKAWKVRDPSMFAELDASEFVVDNAKSDMLIPVDGIALSPPSNHQNKDRLVYYCAIGSLNLYAVSTKILKNEELYSNGNWRKNVIYVGKKQSQSDGLAIDNYGNFYYGLLTLYGIGKWSIYTPFSTSKIIYQNRETVLWPDTFAFDNNGYLYVTTNDIHKYFDQNYPLSITNEIKFSVLKSFTGTKSYLFH